MAATSSAPYAAIELIARREALALVQQRAAEVLSIPLKVLRGIEGSSNPTPPALIAILQRTHGLVGELAETLRAAGPSAVEEQLRRPPAELADATWAGGAASDLVACALGQVAIELHRQGELAPELLSSRTAARAVRCAVGLSKSAAAAALQMTLDQFRRGEAQRGHPQGVVAELLAMHDWVAATERGLRAEQAVDGEGRGFEVITTFTVAEGFVDAYGAAAAARGVLVPLQLHHVAAARRVAAMTAEGRVARLCAMD